MRFLTKTAARRWVALVVGMGLIMPAVAGCGHSDNTAAQNGGSLAPAPQQAPQSPGLSTKQKVVLVAGAALLYYLYRKDVANNKAAAAGAAGANGHPQLYRSKNGGVYYRDPQNPQHVIWVTASNQPVAVPAAQLQQYAPDYQQYQGQPAPAVPAGASSVSAAQYDPSLAGGPSGPPGPGG